MANPQRENGHVDIANEIMDHLIKIRIPGEERQIFDVIMRQTWGYCELNNGKPYKDKDSNWVKKKFDVISYTQFEIFTGIKRRKIWNIINKLLEKNLIIKKGDGLICKYGIQKDWEKWKVSKKKVTITNNGDTPSPIMVTVTNNGDTPSPIMVTELSPIMVHTKEKKENIQKKIISSQIENLLSLFPEMIRESIQVYWDNAAQKNKTGSITEGRKLTLLTELYNLMKRTDDNNLFGYALETANRYGVPNIGYVGAVIKNKITEVKD